MKNRFVVFATACLSYFLVPATGTSLLAAAAATKGIVIGGLAGAAFTSGGSETVVVQTKPSYVVSAHQPPQVLVEHKPVTLVPLATIPSYSLTDRLARLWSGFSNSVGGKIRAVGEFFHPPPRVVLVNVDTTTTTTTPKPKPTTMKPLHPVVVEIVAGVPQHRYVSVLEDCDKK